MSTNNQSEPIEQEKMLRIGISMLCMVQFECCICMYVWSRDAVVVRQEGKLVALLNNNTTDGLMTKFKTIQFPDETKNHRVTERKKMINERKD